MLLIVIGIGLIFLAINYIGTLLTRPTVGRVRDIMHTAIGRGPFRRIASDTPVTCVVQPSSATMSPAMSPAGSGAFGLKQIHPFTPGTEIGTCQTALLAATAVPGNGEAALQIAFIHQSYNVLGVLVIYGLPFLRFLPVHAAEWLGRTASENEATALGYILGVPSRCRGSVSV